MSFELFQTLFAQSMENATPKSPSLWEILVMPLGLITIMYFFILRPQTKRAKDHQNLITNLKAGDEVIALGGIIGKIKSISEGFIVLEIGQNSNIKILKSAISSLTKPPQGNQAPGNKA